MVHANRLHCGGILTGGFQARAKIAWQGCPAQAREALDLRDVVCLVIAEIRDDMYANVAAQPGDYGAPRTVTCESKGRPGKGFKGPNVGFRCCLPRTPAEADAESAETATPNANKGVDAQGGTPAGG